MSEYDVIVIGAGPAGEVCAGRLGEAGLSVALVERDLVGGECSYYACMPSKGLLRPGQALAEVRRVAGAAQAVTGELDVQAALSRRDEIVHGLSDAAQLPWLEKRSVELVRSHGELVGEREVRAGGQTLRARRAVVLAPGSVALIPPVPGLAEARPWTNREATTAHEVPASLLVLGGGVAGSELASAYASLGAAVTLIEAGPRLIAGEEEVASELVLEGLRGQGVQVLLGMKAVRVERAGPGGTVTVQLDRGEAVPGGTDSGEPVAAAGTVSGEPIAAGRTVSVEPVAAAGTDSGEPTAAGDTVSGEQLLVATGRKPLTDAIGLDAVGLEPGGYVEVDDTMRVPGHDWLYVIGDANGRALLTHMGKHQARLSADHILGRSLAGALTAAPPVVPRVVFTEPQVAAAGMTQAQARDAGIELRCAEADLEANAGASYVGHGAGGRAIVLADSARGVLVGATFVGVEVSELLHTATVAIAGEVPLERLAAAVPSFPTRSEVWLTLLAGLGL